MANPLKLLELKPTGLQFIHELPVAAPPKKVWKALLSVGKWFVFDPDPRKWPKQTLEARPGGRWFVERKDGSSSLHGLVTHVEPEKLLRLSGPIGLSHLPVSTAVIFELQERAGGNGALLRVGVRVFGFLHSEVKQRYPEVWKQFLPKIKALAEGK